MDPSVPSKLSLDSLLEHRDFVRRLAQRLVSDPSSADDLEQECWLTSMRHTGEEPSSPRGWLSKVARNLALESFRSAKSRRLREVAVSPKEALPSTEEVVSAAEVHQVVVRAVLGLDEPYRSTLLLRFFSGAPPRVIAARENVSVETVRSRLTRGLALLRGRISTDRGEDWRSWLLPVLLPRGGAEVLGLTMTHAKAGGMKMGIAKLGVLGLSLLVGSFAGWLFLRDPLPSDAPPAISEATDISGATPRSTPSVIPILTTPSEEAPTDEPRDHGRRLESSLSAPKQQPSGTLTLHVDVQPMVTREDTPMTLIATFGCEGIGPVEIHIPDYVSMSPFPKWRFIADSGEIYTPAGRSFQSMWVTGLKGEVLKLMPGDKRRFEFEDVGFVRVDANSSEAYSWAPALPLPAGNYQVSAVFESPSAVVPIGEPGFQISYKEWPTLYTGTVKSSNIHVRIDRAEKRRMTITPGDIEAGTRHLIRVAFDNPGSESWTLPETLRAEVCSKAKGSITTNLRTGSEIDGPLVIPPKGTIVREFDLALASWSRAYRMHDAPDTPTFGLYEALESELVAVVISGTEADVERPLRSNSIFTMISGLPDVSSELGLSARVIGPGTLGMPSLEITVTNKSAGTLRVPRDLAPGRTLDFRINRLEGQSVTTGSPSATGASQGTAPRPLSSLIPVPRAPRPETPVSIRTPKTSTLGLGDFESLEPLASRTVTIDLGSLLENPSDAIPGKAQVRVLWSSYESARRLGSNALFGRVETPVIPFEILSH